MNPSFLTYKFDLLLHAIRREVASRIYPATSALHQDLYQMSQVALGLARDQVCRAYEIQIY